ncbi:MAG: UxaA family hydrolase [Steroidobacter sp.]
MKPFDPRLLLLSEHDNVVVACANLRGGEIVRMDGENVKLGAEVSVGFKIARRDFDAGEKVTKYGAPIGSTTTAIRRGEIVHLHNMKSDYLPTYVHDGGVGFTKR